MTNDEPNIQKLDYEKPVSARSRAWCSTEGCTWKAWGVWSHTKAKAHHEQRMHMIHVLVPDAETAS